MIYKWPSQNGLEQRQMQGTRNGCKGLREVRGEGSGEDGKSYLFREAKQGCILDYPPLQVHDESFERTDLKISKLI